MSSFKPEQHFLSLRGRELHFVAYEGSPGNVKKNEPATAAMWYLMSEGKRHRVMEYLFGQPEAERDVALREWAELHVFGEKPSKQARAALKRHMADLKRDR